MVWFRFWILFPLLLVLAVLVTGVTGLETESLLTPFVLIAWLALISRLVVPGIMFRGDPRPPLRRRRATSR